jgi:hypothetical protein
VFNSIFWSHKYHFIKLSTSADANLYLSATISIDCCGNFKKSEYGSNMSVYDYEDAYVKTASDITNNLTDYVNKNFDDSFSEILD